MAKKQKTLNGEVINMDKWINPKIKVRRVFKIEEDGTKTRAHVIEHNGRSVFHHWEEPAVVNKEQRRKEYYLNGIQFTKEEWDEIRKGREGLPWYKTAAGKGTSRH